MTSFPTEKLRDLSKEVSNLALNYENEKALQKLKPVLDTKIKFRKLDLMGEEIGGTLVDEPQKFIELSDQIVEYDAMGGYVIVGRGLTYFLENRFDKVMEKSKEYIIMGDEWYVCDIIGERSIGHGLVHYFDKTLPWLEEFLQDTNNWIKRSAGTAIHFFSKRVLDKPDKTKKLLNLVGKHIEEKQEDAVKGIGWGLKTIGKYHPELLVEFLKKQLDSGKDISGLMMRKAQKYLEENRKAEIEKIAEK